MTQWGKYILREKIAQGGMAEIFAADCVAAGRGDVQRVCIKRIRPEYSDNSEFRQMFEREARIARAIRHPNVVNVFDFDTHQERCFIAMELIDGWDLKKILNSAREIGATLPVGFAFYVFGSVLEALSAASSVWVDGKQQAVIHRDISPHNVLISRKGDVKLTDFGIAKSRDGSMMTRTGVIKGKLAYLAPEQVDGREIGPQTDQFCLGLVLYEMLAGRRVNQGKGEGEALAAAMNPPVPNIPWLSAEINGFLKTLLARDGSERFPSPDAARNALQQLTLPAYTASDASLFLQGLITSEMKKTVETIDPRVAMRAAQTTIGEIPVGTVESSVAFPSWRKSRLRRASIWVWGAVAALLIAGVVAGGLFVDGDVLQSKSDAIRLTDANGTVQQRKDADSTIARSTREKEKKPQQGDVVMRLQSTAPVADSPSIDESVVGDETENTAEDTGMSHGPTVLKRTAPAISMIPATSDGDKPDRHQIGSESTGRLQVLCRPWAYVSVDGNDMGTTPLAGHTVSAGRHTVVLENKELNFRKKMTVFVRRGKLTKISERIVASASSAQSN